MRRLVCLIALAAVVGGCSSGSFVGQRFDNFTAFYNKFYNARKSFDRGVTALQRQAQAVDRDVYFSVFPTLERPGNNRDLDAAIRRSADILRHHPESRWVDDALLLIGQSYFYLQNFVGAEQKFREVIELRSPLSDEAHFWLARTLLANNSNDRAAFAIEEALSLEQLHPRWRAKLKLVAGDLAVRRGDWETAETRLAEGLAAVRDREMSARASFLLGQVRERLGNYPDAITAFEQVGRFAPPYELEYAGLVSAARVLGMHVDLDEGLRRIRRLERDDKHSSYRADLVFVRGRMLQANGLGNEAYWTYQDVLYGFDGNIGAARQRAHHALAELYRDYFVDFPRAAAHFDTAGTGQPRPAAQVARQYVPGALAGSSEQAQVFGAYARAYEQVALLDSLMYLGSLDQSDFDAFVLGLREERAREMEALQREADRREQQARFEGAVQTGTPVAGGQSAAAAGRGNFLFHRDAARVQENRAGFVDRWGERPLVPNWRRHEALVAFAEERTGEDGEPIPVVAAAPGVGLPEVDVSAVPRDPESRSRMHADLAEARYNVGNVLFLHLSRPDSAAAWYRMVVDETPELPVAGRALYALAEVQRAAGDSASADALYETVLQRYPGTEIADGLMRRLGRAPALSAAGDSLARAEQAYNGAVGLWRAGSFEDAFNQLVEIAFEHPGTAVAPRSLLAASIVYQEWMAAEGGDVLAPLPMRFAGVVPRDGPPAAAPRPSPTVDPEAEEEEGEKAEEEEGEKTNEANELAPEPEPEVEPVFLRDLLRLIATRYNGTPESERARDIVDGLDELKKGRAESPAEARLDEAEAEPLS
jgi:cellulose synthase operon protein C